MKSDQLASIILSWIGVFYLPANNKAVSHESYTSSPHRLDNWTVRQCPFLSGFITLWSTIHTWTTSMSAFPLTFVFVLHPSEHTYQHSHICTNLHAQPLASTYCLLNKYENERVNEWKHMQGYIAKWFSDGKKFQRIRHVDSHPNPQTNFLIICKNGSCNDLFHSLLQSILQVLSDDLAFKVIMFFIVPSSNQEIISPLFVTFCSQTFTV